MGWLAGSLTFRFISVMRSPPARRTRSPYYRSAGHRLFSLRVTLSRGRGLSNGFELDSSKSVPRYTFINSGYLSFGYYIYVSRLWGSVVTFQSLWGVREQKRLGKHWPRSMVRWPIPVAVRSKARATLGPEPTQHNSLDRLQIRK